MQEVDNCQCLHSIYSYFSTSITSSTCLHTSFSPFTRDKIFCLLGMVLQYTGIGHAHHNNKEAHQAIYLARSFAQKNPTSIIILIFPNSQWYQNITQLIISQIFTLQRTSLQIQYHTKNLTSHQQLNIKPKTNLTIHLLYTP